MFLNLYSEFESFNLPWLQSKNESMFFSNSNMINPALDILQKNANILSLIDDIELYLNKIAFNEVIEIFSGNYSYILTEKDKMDFLSIIGNILGLPPFSIQSQSGFILDVDQLDIGRFGQSGDVELIKSYEFAKFLMARILKFYGYCTIDNIYNSVVNVSQEPPSNVSADFEEDKIIFTISSRNIDRARLFIEYIDQYGYNLWVKPTYGTIEFIYVSI